MSSIIIVGNSSSVLEKSYGEKIDTEYDYVCRVNDFKTEGFEKHVGTRCDIWCIGVGPYKNVDENNYNIKELWYKKSHRGRYDSCGEKVNKIRYVPPSLKKTLSYESIKIPLQNPTTGFKAIVIAVLRHIAGKFTKVDLHGFTLFADRDDQNNYMHYYDKEATRIYPGDPKKKKQHFLSVEKQYVIDFHKRGWVNFLNEDELYSSEFLTKLRKRLE